MEISELETKLLALVKSPGYRPVKPRVIADQLDLSQDDRRELKRVIKRLVKRGQLEYGANHLLRPPSGTPTNVVTGVFRRAQGGFGFVRPHGTMPSEGRDQDIYIPADRAADASTGDTVLVRIVKSAGWRGKQEGAIAEVIERETHQFVGTYFESAGTGYVQVDGKLFSAPISLGDASVKGVQPDDKVVIEMVRFPSHLHDGEGVITQVLGQRGEPGVDTMSIIHEFNLPQEFPADVLDDARRQAEKFNEAIGKRLDLTDETIITIDPIDARDFDDAISLERLDNGHWRLGVHIADVSHFVRPNKPLDREAYHRATSVYLPDRVIPMIPEIISNSLASLQPDKVRYTKTVFIEFTADGARVASDLHAAAIRSKRRFTYEEVDDYLAHRDRWRGKLTPEVHDLLGRMYELSRILRARRIQRGALELSMPEVKVDLDKQGEVCGAHVVENTESHQIIEEFMLAANEAVAERLREAELFFLRRVHMPPDPRKLKALTSFVSELGFETESLESRFELQKLLNLVVGRPEERAVNYAVLRSLQRAIYSPSDEGHYALASDCYCHFTSPIRRYPDLTVHRLVETLLLKKKPVNNIDELYVQGEHCSQREQRAEAAERELTRVKLLNYLSTRLGETMDAVITGVEEYGLFAQGIQLPAEGLIHVTSLQDDYYRYERASHTLSGHRSGNVFRLGDLVRVEVVRVDVDRRELDFRVVGRKKRPPIVGKPSRDGRRGGAKSDKLSPRGSKKDRKKNSGKAKKSKQRGRRK